MVVVGDLLPKRQRVRLPDAVSTGITRPVRGSVIDVRIVVERPKILHDVNLAAGGPADRIDVLA